MSGLTYAQIDDAVLLTQEQLVKRGAFVDMQTDLQDHVAVREVWKKRKKKFSGGETWNWQIQMDHNYSAKTTALYETDGSSVTDSMVTGSVDARFVNAHYIYDQKEPAFQKGGTGIVDLVKTRYTGMMVSLFELLETILWSKPANVSDTKTPFGIPYWVTKSATEGFFGANPVGFTAGKGGISQGTYARWANYTAQYTTVSKTDLIRKMRTCHRKSQFRSPVSHSNPDVGPMENGIYLNSETIGLVEERLEEQNMSLGNDVASKDGKSMFKGTHLTYVPKLDSDADDPVYMLDWRCLAVGVLAGWEENLSKPYMVPNKHTVRRVDLDASLNMICTNLRKQGVISK